jgi:hypothetical protein
MDTLEDTHHYFSHMNTVVSSPFSRRVDLRSLSATIVKPSSREGATAVTPKGGAPVAQIRRELLLNLAGRCLGHLPRGAPR